MAFVQGIRKTVMGYSGFIITVSVILLAVGLIYWRDFAILFNEAAQNEAMGHVILVPVLSIFLMYRRRQSVKASLAMQRPRKAPKTVSLYQTAGIAVCLFAFLLYWYGSYTFYPLEYHIVSFVIFTSGLILTLFNAKTLLALSFPLLFMAFLIPIPSNFLLSAGGLLGNFTAEASYTLLKAAGVPVGLSSAYGPPVITLNNSNLPPEFGIDVPCSGVYSLVAFTMFALFLGLIAEGSIHRKLILAPLGFLTLIGINILRISLIISVAHGFGEMVAMTLFHTFSGWLLIFGGMLLLLFSSEKLLHLHLSAGPQNHSPNCRSFNVSKNNEAFCPNCGKLLENARIRVPRRFWVKLAIVLLASFVVAQVIQAPVFALAQGLITNPDPHAEDQIFPQVAGYQLTFLNRDRYFENLSHQDASLLYAYVSENISNPTVYILMGVASSIVSLHSWEVCLVTLQAGTRYEQSIKVLDSRDALLMQNPPIAARYLMFESQSNYTQATLYWYQQTLFKTGQTVQPRYIRTSLMVLAPNSIEAEKSEERLLSIGQSITAYWEPIKAQSLIALGIPSMQASLGLTVIFTIGITGSQLTYARRKKAVRLKIFEKLAARDEKLLYETVKSLSQENRETSTQNIKAALDSAGNKPIKLEELVERLQKLEQDGIIRTDVINVFRQPVLVWKP